MKIVKIHLLLASNRNTFIILLFHCFQAQNFFKHTIIKELLPLYVTPNSRERIFPHSYADDVVSCIRISVAEQDEAESFAAWN